MSEVALNPEKLSAPHNDIDKVYDYIEGNGRYKFLVLFAACIAYLCHMFFLFSIPFFLVKPTATCNLDGYWHECTQKEVCDNPDVLYRFEKPVEFNFVTEFGWYCDETTPPFFTATAFFLGTTFSVLIVSTLSDMVGRLPMLIAGILGNMLGLGFLIVFAGPHVCFVASFLIGFFTMANNSSSFNFLADSVPESYRESLPTVMNIAWALGEIVLALIMWSGIQWRGMCLFIFIFSASFFIPLYWLRESPKFYFSQGKIREAQLRLKNMASFNGVDSSDIHLTASAAGSGKGEQISFSQRLKIMCCEASMLKQILLVTAMFAIGNMIFYAMSLNLENMGGNAYVNGIFLAIAEVVACTCSGLALKVVNAKLALSASFSLTVVGLTGLGIFWDDPLWSIVFCVLGKLGSTSIDNLLYTLSGVFFPTAILGGALGIALFGTRFGNVLAKPMYLLGPKVMCFIMVALGIIAAVLPLFLTVRKEEKKEESSAESTEGEH